MALEPSRSWFHREPLMEAPALAFLAGRTRTFIAMGQITRVNAEREQAVVAGVVLPLEQLIPCKKTTASAAARLPPPPILEVLSTLMKTCIPKALILTTI